MAEWLAFVLTHIVNGANVRMVQGRGGASLYLQLLDGPTILGKLLRQKLEGDKPAESQIFCFANHSHSAATQLFDNPVVTDHGFGQAEFSIQSSIGTLPQCGRARASKCRRLDEAPGFIMMSQQRLHLPAEVLIARTRLPDQLVSASFFHLQGSVKDLLDLLPAFTLHRVSLRSVRAAAKP
jgi:hypothetical protein